MYRLSRGVRFLRPTRLIQNSRRLTNNLGSVSAQVEVLTQNVTKDEQSEDVSLKKEGFPLHVADPLQRQRLSHAARAVRSLLVRVDYIPDGTTEEELRELLSKYGDVVRVRLGTSSAEQFFGRAYAMFSTGSELREALEKLRGETLTVRGAQLTVDVVQPPPNLTETIFVGNINSDNTSDEDIMTAFSKYGNIQALRRGDQGRYAHIVYDSPQAAELVINRTTIEPISLHGNTLAVGASQGAAKRVLHVAGFPGGTADIVSLFKESENHIEGLRIVPSKSRDGTNMAWITFRTIGQAAEARAKARESHPQVSVMYSSAVPVSGLSESSSPRTRPLLTQATSTSVSPSPSVVPSVLLVSNVPTSVTMEDLEAFFNQHAPGGVASIVAPRSNPHVLPESVRVAKKEQYDALISLNDPNDVINVVEAHKVSPLSLNDSSLEVDTASLDKLEPLTRTIKLDDVVNDQLTPLIKMGLWEKMGVYGKIQNIRAGRTPGTVFVKYLAPADAFNAIVHLSQNPLVFLGRKARPNFGPVHLRTEEEHRERMQKSHGVAEEVEHV